jgi:hypothetical protein
MIAPTELTQNYERLNTPYDPNQLIETLFQQIQDAQAFAEEGGQPYDTAMIVYVAYTLVFNTLMFPDSCRAWQSGDRGQNMGAIQDRFRHHPSLISSSQPDHTSVWLPQR